MDPKQIRRIKLLDRLIKVRIMRMALSLQDLGIAKTNKGYTMIQCQLLKLKVLSLGLGRAMRANLVIKMSILMVKDYRIILQ